MPRRSGGVQGRPEAAPPHAVTIAGAAAGKWTPPSEAGAMFDSSLWDYCDSLDDDLEEFVPVQFERR